MNENNELQLEKVLEESLTTSEELNNTPETVLEDHMEDISAMISEAEERGYLRGRNEVIEQMMQQPPLFSNQARINLQQERTTPYDEDDPTRDFLAHIRPQVWD